VAEVAGSTTKPEAPVFLAMEIWRDVRPYLRAAITDLLVTCVLWGGVWLFKLAIWLTPLEGWLGKTMATIHSVSAVLMFGAYSGLIVWDILKIRLTPRGSRVE
jgi:hypothetical protein